MQTWTFIAKTAWDDGPWQNEPDKAQWQDKATDLVCLAVRVPWSGHWCGYVGVPEGHPYFNVGYDQCIKRDCEERQDTGWCDHEKPETTMEVHGGLTFSDFCQENQEHGDILFHGTQQPSVSVADAAWAAGLFDGEGSIGMQSEKRSRLRCELGMNDQDMVERFYRIVGVGKIFMKKSTSRVSGTTNPHWCWIAYRDYEIEQVFLIIGPYLSSRRKGRFEELILKRKQALYTICLQCGKAFMAWKDSQLYCSRACNRNGSRDLVHRQTPMQRQSAIYPPVKTGICHVAEPGKPERVWWLGFDCAHVGDFSPAYTRYGITGDTYRDLAYVREQCTDLARQLAAVSTTTQETAQ